MFILEETGFDKSIETKKSLIAVANLHCKSYEERKYYLPIKKVKHAIRYFTENGFTVKKIKPGTILTN